MPIVTPAAAATYTANRIRAAGYPFGWQADELGVSYAFTDRRHGQIDEHTARQVEGLALLLGHHPAIPEETGLSARQITAAKRDAQLARLPKWTKRTLYPTDLHRWCVVWSMTCGGLPASVAAAQHRVAERTAMRYARVAEASPDLVAIVTAAMGVTPAPGALPDSWTILDVHPDFTQAEAVRWWSLLERAAGHQDVSCPVAA